MSSVIRVPHAECRPHLRALISLPPALRHPLSLSLSPPLPLPSFLVPRPQDSMMLVFFFVCTPTFTPRLHHVHASSLRPIPPAPLLSRYAYQFLYCYFRIWYPIYRCDQGPIPIPSRAKDDLFISDPPAPLQPPTPHPPWDHPHIYLEVAFPRPGPLISFSEMVDY